MRFFWFVCCCCLWFCLTGCGESLNISESSVEMAQEQVSGQQEKYASSEHTDEDERPDKGQDEGEQVSWEHTQESGVSDGNRDASDPDISVPDPQLEQDTKESHDCDGAIDCIDHSKDIEALLKNVGIIAAPGTPGSTVVFGRNAFVVAAGGTPGKPLDPVAAAARWGKGRIVIFSHGGYLSISDLKLETTGQLVKNSIQWVAGGLAPQTPLPTVAVVGNIGAKTYLQEQKYTVVTPNGSWWTQMAQYPVWMIPADHLTDPQARTAVLQYLSQGGGLIMAETGWGWAQINNTKDIVSDFAGNLLLREVGLAWSGLWINDANPGYDNKTKPSVYLHAQVALDLLEQHANGKVTPSAFDLAQATHTVTRAIPYLHPGDTLFLPRLEGLLQTHGAQLIPSAKNPIKLEHGLQRILLAYQWYKSNNLPVDQVKAHSASSTFPGPVPANAPRVTRDLDIPSNIPDWHSTGLYAAPGEVVTVTVPQSAANQGWYLRIGAHSDKLWDKDAWNRIPEISKTWALQTTTTKVAHSMGGSIFVVVPKNSKLGTVRVNIQNAVQAPWFVLGKTNLADWKQTLRNHPAPWAELATEKLILTVPSQVVRKLDNPDELMQHWNKVMDVCADLATIPTQRLRPERVVMDEQISAGYMHAGYPIMTHLDVQNALTQTQDIQQKGNWGIYHEIGHNHQSSHWTFDGTTEVTVNLFTLYTFEKIHQNKQPRANIYGTERENMLKKYIKNGTKFSDWKADPFLALVMYMQLQEAFGWQTYQKLFAEYRAESTNLLPKNDDEKRDQWMVRFSKAVGKNLGPFFQAWGVPTSAAARQSVAQLPQWMPTGFPPTP